MVRYCNRTIIDAIIDEIEIKKVIKSNLTQNAFIYVRMKHVSEKRYLKYLIY